VWPYQRETEFYVGGTAYSPIPDKTIDTDPLSVGIDHTSSSYLALTTDHWPQSTNPISRPRPVTPRRRLRLVKPRRLLRHAGL